LENPWFEKNAPIEAGCEVRNGCRFGGGGGGAGVLVSRGSDMEGVASVMVGTRMMLDCCLSWRFKLKKNGDGFLVFFQNDA